MSKVVTIEQVMGMFKDGMTIMTGGFGGSGQSMTLTKALLDSGVTNLNTIGNDNANSEIGIGRLITAKRVKNVIASHIGGNKETQAQFLAGELNVTLVPQGTLAERIRAGGYGLGGILTPTGVGTDIAEGKQVITIDGKDFLLETPLRADIALVFASVAEENGNLYWNYAARNFNPLVAMAADICIVAAEKIVPVGTLNPSDVMLPGVVVDYIVQE